MTEMQVFSFEKPTSLNQLEDLFCDWKRYQTNQPDYVNYFKELFKSKQFANVKIYANDGFGGVQEILAHGCVLKHESDFFSAILSGRWSCDLKVDLTSYEFDASQMTSFISV